MRDYTKLRAFQESDELLIAIYRVTNKFPDSERFGLQSQLRRAALSVPTNIVEGSARASRAEYCRFLELALGSSRECCYLMTVAVRLGFASEEAHPLTQRYERLCAVLAAILLSLRKLTEK